ncbi:MAG: hypothetical protein JRK53_28730, partial [Deltaproteobacteria bacterium]|nr:hypothetical protein [Deltaproteobacteria bacterium]
LAAAPVKRGAWSARISAERLGMGRSTLQSRGLKKDRILAVSHPFIVEISAPESFTAKPLGGLLPLPGLQALVTDEKGKIHECIAGTLSSGPGRRLKHDLESGGIRRVSKIDLEGALHAPALGVFDLELVAGCSVRVEVDDKELVEIAQGQAQERRSFSLCLEKGRHTLRTHAKIT